MSRAVVAVYGATGYTGRLVAAELVRRGYEVVLAGRDAAGLERVAGESGVPDRVRTHHAPLEDNGALRTLADRSDVIVHCAGPFSRTGRPVAEAAVAGRSHYIDHAVESHHVKALFDTFGESSRAAGVSMVPGLSFYGGLGDLLAAAAAAPAGSVERVVVGYSVRGWRLTTGAKETATQLFGETERISFADGVQTTAYLEPRNAVFAFPPPLGPRTMIAPLPSCDIVTIPRHVDARHVEIMITASTFEEDGAFESEEIPDTERACSEFTVAVQTVSRPAGAAAHATGTDLWRMAALASVEGVDLLTAGKGPGGGVFAPAEAFPAVPLLLALQDRGALRLHLTEPKG